MEKRIEKLPDHKYCPDCGEERPFEEFWKHKNGKYGLQEYCKTHRKLRSNAYLKNPKNKEKIKEYARKPVNKEKAKKWRNEFKEKHGISASQLSTKKRMEKDPIYHLRIRRGALIRRSFTVGGYSKNSLSAQILGCTDKEFMTHLTNNGEIEYNKKVHHLDHIIPISLATNEEECNALNHWTNFRLLTKEENFSKSNKLPERHELHPDLPPLALEIYERNLNKRL